MLESPAIPESGDVVLHRYRLGEPLGQGGFGVVFAATDERLRRSVALKFPSLGRAIDAESAARFSREAEVCARLKGEFTNRVYDASIDPVLGPFLVLELLRGRTLSSVLSTDGRLPLALASTYILQACVAVAEAHALSVLHRDLKPANLFVEEGGGAARIKVLDFGVAGLVSDAARLTHSGEVIGTPRYMAPEHALGTKSTDHRADLWSLAVIFYELLTGAPVIDGASGLGFLVAASHGTVPIRNRWPGVPHLVELVLAQALAVDPARRFQNAGALAMALSAIAPEHARALGPRAMAMTQH